MTTTHDGNPNMSATPVLYVSLELGQRSWKLAFTVGLGQKPRLKTIPAQNTDTLLAEIQAAKTRSGLPEAAAVAACYEAGRLTIPRTAATLRRAIPCVIIRSGCPDIFQAAVI